MPFGAVGYFESRAINHHSPFSAVSTPSDVEATTPTQDSALTPKGPPSPLSVALQKKLVIDRANMFFEGSHDKLLRSMDLQERRRVVRRYLHIG
jgi:hypothetical protein